MPSNSLPAMRRAANCAFVFAFLVTSEVAAVPITGKVMAPAARPKPRHAITLARVVIPSVAYANARVPVALYLTVKESTPIPPSRKQHEIVIRGRLPRPAVVACLYGEKVKLRNADEVAISVRVGEVDVGKIDAGASKTYSCEVSGNHRMRLEGMPFAQATVFVGEVGVVASPNAEGLFTMDAPAGTYELLVVTHTGVLSRTPVKVGGDSVDVGVLEFNADGKPKAVPARRIAPAAVESLPAAKPAAKVYRRTAPRPPPKKRPSRSARDRSSEDDDLFELE